MTNEARDLGMDRPIARRDFLNGIAVGITGAAAFQGAEALAAQTSPVEAANYPPLRTGLRGEYPSSVGELDRIRQGEYSKFPVRTATSRKSTIW
jgi:spermidine dehydrogenase